MENSEKSKLGKFRKIAIRKISKIFNLKIPKISNLGKSKKFAILENPKKFPKFYNVENHQISEIVSHE